MDLFSFAHNINIKVAKINCILFSASRSIQTQEDNDYEIITAYVEDNNSLHPDNDLHSGPPSFKVSNTILKTFMSITHLI